MTMRRIVIAPDSFRGSITATAAARALARGWSAVAPDDAVVVSPMADGGEGTLEAIATALPAARWMPVRVTGPDDRAVGATWLLLPPTDDLPGGTAVVELARTSGIELLARPLPLDAHTRGLGEAIADALAHRPSRLVVALGGSASTDGGMGVLTALGARATDAEGAPLADGGAALAGLAHLDLTGLPSLPPGGVVALTDVSSPLLGPRGAAAVFGPQKGAGPAEIALLDRALARLVAVAGTAGDAPGSGAAGGTGYGLRLWGARLSPGAAAVAAMTGLAATIAEADLVITGEGSFDGQTAAGKAPAEVARLATAAGVPVALVAGRIAPGADVGAFAATVSLTDLAGSAEAATADPERWLAEAGGRLAHALR